MTSVREVAELVVNMAAFRELKECDKQGSGKQAETKSDSQWNQKGKKAQLAVVLKARRISAQASHMKGAVTVMTKQEVKSLTIMHI
jgi:hypothetical protein